MKTKREFIKVQKSVKFTGVRELKFINKYGLKGWDFFALYMPPYTTGFKIYHFRKDVILKPTTNEERSPVIPKLSG